MVGQPRFPYLTPMLTFKKEPLSAGHILNRVYSHSAMVILIRAKGSDTMGLAVFVLDTRDHVPVCKGRGRPTEDRQQSGASTSPT